MEVTLSLKEEVDKLMKNNLSVKKVDSNKRVEKTKDLLFKELKNILAKFNKNYLFKVN
jgi:hypothetical protein